MNLIDDYDYHLPPELVAQYPLKKRDASRLLVLHRDSGEIRHAAFKDLGDWLNADDLLVLNDTRVFPARLKGQKASGGKVELLLHHLPSAAEGGEEFGGGGEGPAAGETPVPPAPAPPRKGPAATARARATYRGRLKVGQTLQFGELLQAEVLALVSPGVAELRFHSLDGDAREALRRLGEVPLPPYIRRPPQDLDGERYQTVYAARPGAVAAPTAGLHFSAAVLRDLARRSIDTVHVTLHVGPGTFLPVRHSDYTRHQMHPEAFELSQATAARLHAARTRGQRLTAVGTTSVRVLEHCAAEPGGFKPRQGWCDLFIYPGYRFQAVDRLLTNFHLPRSTLLLLVSAFAGRDLILKAYAEAVQEGYRFYSYGDCMLIL
jgi:S-adenosylmethionine:tRNA ribosyltransferase-isomerase